MLINKATCFLFLFLFSSGLLAQQKTTIKGRVTEVGTNEGIPFVIVFFKGIQTGTTSDFEGDYSITTTKPTDSIYASVMGYQSITNSVIQGTAQTINFHLKPTILNLKTIEILPGVNPALRIVKNAIRNKDQYNRDQLESVQFTSYTIKKTDVDNISENVRKWKMFKPIFAMWDSLDVIAGKGSDTRLPAAITEVKSDIYYYKKAKNKHEDVKAVLVKFVGMKDGSSVSQLTGTDFLYYNFSNTNVPILDKDFLSPLADNALLFYNYYLVDSTFIDSTRCYRIDVRPKNKQDLAYTGTLWITDTTFVLKQLDLEITKDVNFNLVDRARIRQKLIPTTAGPWVPAQTQVTIDYTNLTKKMLSLVTNTYNRNHNFIVNQPKKKEFYETRIQFAEDAITKDSTYWIKERPKPLTPIETQSYRVIDTIREMPVVKRTTNLLYLLFTGYKDVGPVDFGHYMKVYGHNKYEGDRYRLGFRTNANFNKSWIIRSYAAYGLRDQEFKYNLQLERILTRYPWSKAGIQYRKDIDQIGFNNEFSQNINLSQSPNYLYNTFSQIGNVSKLIKKEESRIWYEKDFNKGFNTKVVFQNIHTSPLFPVKFGNQFNIFQQSKFTITEAIINIRLSAKERYIQNGTERISLGNKKSPIIGINYTAGLKNVLGGDFEYHKASISASHRFRMATMGHSTFFVKAGKVFSQIPYIALEIPRGNQTNIYANNIFNQMNLFEFVSDQYVEAFWQHHFMGVFFNRLPLIKKMKLREVIGANIVYGTLSEKNRSFNSDKSFTVMTDTPYIEASAGIENIFKVIKIGFVYRLTYIDDLYKTNYSLNNPGNSINNWSIKAGLQFSL